MILIIGSRGRIGTRYRHILKTLKVDYCEYDPALRFDESDDFDPDAFDMTIIASPTKTHFKYCNQMMDLKKPFLCEKPLSHDLIECEKLAERQIKEGHSGFVVNNWSFVMPNEIDSMEYNYYQTGPDGFVWDLSQLIYIADKNNAMTRFNNESVIWNARVNGKSIAYREIELSYFEMIRKFLIQDEESLWNLQDGFLMSVAVNRYAKEHDYETSDCRDPSPHRIYSSSC